MCCYYMLRLAFRKKQNQTANGFFLFYHFQCGQPLKALCTASHLRLHTYVRAVMTSLQVPPSRHEHVQLSCCVHMYCSDSDVGSAVRMVGELSPLVYWGDNQPFATAVWPSRSSFKATLVERNGEWCGFMLLNVGEHSSFVTGQSKYCSAFSRTLSMIEHSECPFPDWEKLNLSDCGLYMHFKGQIIIKLRQDSYYLLFFYRMHRLAAL